jgi:hypothetical protein
MVRALCAGAVPPIGLPFVGAGANTFMIDNGSSSGAWGPNSPGNWTVNDFIQLAITYKAANWLG